MANTKMRRRYKEGRKQFDKDVLEFVKNLANASIDAGVDKRTLDVIATRARDLARRAEWYEGNIAEKETVESEN